jgi:hypothetical protein
MSSGSVITYTDWNEMVSHTYMSSTGLWGVSSQLVAISSAVLANTLHSANSDIHSFSAESYMTSANIIANYAKSSNLYNTTWIDSFSGNIDTRIDALGSFDPTNYMTSANIITNYAKSSNLYNKVWIDTFSGNVDTRIGALGGFDPTNYMVSTQALANFYPSALGVGVSSAVLVNTLHSANSDLHSFSAELYITSANALANFRGSSADTEFTNSGVIWNGSNWVAWKSGAGGLWTETGSDIYYDNGEVRIGHSGFDTGTYKFQVSGPSFFSGAVNFIGELSGLADPTYDSGAASKHYVDVRPPSTTEPSKIAGTLWMSGNTDYCRLYMISSTDGSWMSFDLTKV